MRRWVLSWRRIILYANFFIPGASKADLGLGPVAAALKQPQFPLGWGGWLPFQWRDTESLDFAQFSAKGKPNVLPIIQIILARDPPAVSAWLDEMKAWDFEQFAGGGKPNILPIIQIILARGPEALEAWVGAIKGWDFKRVVPAHLDAPLEVGFRDFAATFDFAFGDGKNEVRSCDEDVRFLRKAEEGVLSFSVYESPYGTLRGKAGPCGL